ncbi:alpha/beta fold hydrolase [Streptomyces sp. NPDC048290]|uniref:thioesterase domain-containing protein n=1 Tax=Streptomyces sp. NPDC048290 TaxID=3155811 RepID=UPI003412B72D
MRTEDEVRHTVRELWSQVLENDELAGDTDFFAAGGSSLKSLILLTELNDAFATEFEPAELADCRTLDAQSTAIWNRLTRAGTTPGRRRTAVLPLTKPTTDPGTPTIIAVHDISGDLYGYTSLARELSGRAHLYGIKLTHEEFEAPRSLSVPDLAEEYVTALATELDGPRPAVLLGWSLGGPIAFEMAKLLDTQGRPPHRLILLDAPYGIDLPNPDTARDFTPEHERALLDGFPWLGDLPDGGSSDDLWRTVRTLLDAPAKDRLTTELQHRFPLLARSVPHLASLNESEFIGYLNRFRSLLHAARALAPEGTTTAPIDFLAATESPTYDPRWSSHTTASFRHVPLNGDHFTLLDRTHAPATARAVLSGSR